MADAQVTTSEAMILFAASGVRITRQHVWDWSRPTRSTGPLITSVGRRGKEALWSWSALLRAERMTRARRAAFATERDVQSKRGR